MAEYAFIDTVAEVEELAAKLALEKVIAVDTEADSFFHYFDKLCLVQISASCGTFLIDPLSMPPRGLDAARAGVRRTRRSARSSTPPSTTCSC